jgi:Ser/Thr protein kinase RdoA (MazF antagonist)
MDVQGTCICFKRQLLIPAQAKVMIESILKEYGFDTSQVRVETFGNGLINHTWKFSTGDKVYIAQRINNEVFKAPEDIAHNISVIAEYLKAKFPGYQFIAPMLSTDGRSIIHDKDGGYFRVFPFVAGSHSMDFVETPQQAFEAAAQFGRFSKLLSGIDISKIKITIPGFHDLSLRYKQFLHALEHGNRSRILEAKELIKKLKGFADIVSVYESILQNPEFKLRVTHHDTKISNVLFDSHSQGLCVIDLDTVMPGYFISDVGDMMRTCICPVSEEEQDFSKVQVRKEFYDAIVDGYFSEMKDELTDTEKKYFLFAGRFLIYMQAIRFLTDYLQNDVYYGAAYPQQNFVRAGNQTVLLEQLSRINAPG